MNQDQEHIRLLSIFHYVCAGLTALFACFPIIHLVIGIMMIASPHTFAGKDNVNDFHAFMGWFFIAFAAIFILAGWTLAILLFLAGRYLSKYKHYTYCFVIAAIACAFFPFGTVLGVFTLIVLSRPTARELFYLKPAANIPVPPPPPT